MDKEYLYVLLFLLLDLFSQVSGQLPKLNPGDPAPSFVLHTLRGGIVYKPKNKKKETSGKPSHPIVFHAFSKKSAFLEALWTEKNSLKDFLQNSPRNTRYVFMSFGENAQEDMVHCQKLFHKAVDDYEAELKSIVQNSTNYNITMTNNTQSSMYITGLRDEPILQKRSNIPHLSEEDSYSSLRPSRHTIYKMPHNNYSSFLDKEQRITTPRLHSDQRQLKFHDIYQVRGSIRNHTEEMLHRHKNFASLSEKWKDRVFFVKFPVDQLGNWIPYVMYHWPCLGSTCASAQISLIDKKGDFLKVVKRLDARYDWLPSPHQLSSYHSKLPIKYLGNGCSKAGQKIPPYDMNQVILTCIALISREGNCSYYEKIMNAAHKGAAAVIIYTNQSQPIAEIHCYGDECSKHVPIAATMIGYDDGMFVRKYSKAVGLFARFQSTSQPNFFFAVDGQGKLAEVGLFLYPSLRFLAREAQWFNYKTDLVHNATGSSKIIPITKDALMSGKTGIMKTIQLPPIKELLMYRNAELDLSLRCPQDSDYSCPHWDHTLHLTVCCDKDSPLCGEELGRWITPYRRAIGRWLTPITSLLPLFTSSECTFTLKTVWWEKPWKPELSIRLSDHIKYSKHQYSVKESESNLVPYHMIKLFEGGTFDKNYNKKYKPHSFTIPKSTKAVKLVAIITGHGSDNNGCAEFCVTSHEFIFNKKHKVIRIFKNAATSRGCENRVMQGVEPNEHGTWLYGRDGWCPGHEVVPWVEDVTKFVKFNGDNNVNYSGLFKGIDPNPVTKPGTISMKSYIVFYKSAADI